jgi:hypothetical protein
VLSILLPGCRVCYRGAPAAPSCHYLNTDKDLFAVGKIVLLELDNNSSYPQMSADVSEALFQALQKRQIFSVAPVRRNDAAWRSLQLDSNGAYTLQQLSEMRKTFRCSAVLTGIITEFRPYPHLVIGLRLRMIDLKDGQLLWAIEQVWDTADKTTERRIRDYYCRQMRSDSARMQEKLATVSSIKFIKFVAYEVSETLRDTVETPGVVAFDIPPRHQASN